MKAALITEEQIKAIEDALGEMNYSNSTGMAKQKYIVALAIVKSLKVQEPVAMVYDAYDCNGLHWFCDNPPSRRSMLYAGEQP